MGNHDSYSDSGDIQPTEINDREAALAGNSQR